MRTAIITGASSGLGVEFVRLLTAAFPDLESVWLIARRRERLEELAAQYCDGLDVHVLPLDLCDESSFTVLRFELDSRKPDVRLLVNNAGCGYLGNVGETDAGSQTRMTKLNVTALTAVTDAVLPYMGRGARIINMSSIASFCPNARMTVYSSTKAYVSSFTRGLSEEVRARGIRVTAVCPGPMATEFLDIGGIAGNSKMFQTLPYCDPEKVAAGAYAAAIAGHAFYTPKLFYKFYRVLAKIIPHSLMVKLAKT
ncbi:MAG: SDR family NAD(P)-dependent oxidoreductase [Butyricicoccus sp.]|nr:SDR family NAD(P)-dependent oxidoreductase [Butyricicoccus sp.]